MTLQELHNNMHRRILDLRAVEAIIKAPTFERLYKDSDHESRYEVTQYVEQGRKEALKNWMSCHPSIELGELSHNQLKSIGKDYSILNWSRLTKPELIMTIQKYEENRDG